MPTRTYSVYDSSQLIATTWDTFEAAKYYRQGFYVKVYDLITERTTTFKPDWANFLLP